MRILLAAKYLHYPQGGGGLERNTHELCLRLVRRGIQPAVMCDIHNETSIVALKNRLARKLRPAIRFPMDSNLGYPVFRGWSSENGAGEVVSRFKPDIVVAQSAEPVPLLESFSGFGIPRMAYFHEVERIWDVDSLVAMGNVGLLANSEFTARKMGERAGFMPAVIRPLIDPPLYRTPTKPKNVLFINTSKRKGVDVALRLAEKRPDISFDFVVYWNSSVSDIEGLTARAKALGNVALHERTNNMRPLYGRARVLLAPSQWAEAWGRVATEAQINGIPVLASKRGGLPEAVGDGGILVDHDAPIEEWTRALSALWDDPANYAKLSAAALRHGERPEIQPETIVSEFIGAVGAFAKAHSGASVA